MWVSNTLTWYHLLKAILKGDHYKPESYSTFQVGCLREIGSNGEIGIRSINAKILILLLI